VPLRVDPGAALDGDDLAVAVGVQEIVGHVRGAAAEPARLVGHADLGAQHVAAVAGRQRAVVLKLHLGLVGAKPGERVSLEDLPLLRRERRGRVLAHAVGEVRRRDEAAPARVLAVSRVAVQRVVVAVPVGEVAGGVGRHLGDVGRADPHRDADALARTFERLVAEDAVPGPVSGHWDSPVVSGSGTPSDPSRSKSSK
jgi:hypothetical protein